MVVRTRGGPVDSLSCEALLDFGPPLPWRYSFSIDIFTCTTMAAPCVIYQVTHGSNKSGSLFRGRGRTYKGDVPKNSTSINERGACFGDMGELTKGRGGYRTGEGMASTETNENSDREYERSTETDEGKVSSRQALWGVKGQRERGRRAKRR